MRIIPAKFQPSRTNGVGGDRSDRRTRDVNHFPANAIRISTSSLASLGREYQEIWKKLIFFSSKDQLNKVVSVKREADSASNDKIDGEKQEKNFGLTTPRNWGMSEEPVLNKRLGIYQRPMSAHGVRNQQVKYTLKHHIDVVVRNFYQKNLGFNLFFGWRLRSGRVAG